MAIKRISLDTNAISYLFRGDHRVLKVMNEAEVIFLPYFTIAELIAGFKGGKKYEQNMKLLRSLERKMKVSRIYPSDKTLDIFTKIFIDLKSKGTPIPIHDIWIAALAREKDSVIITFDHHFKHISNVRTWQE